MNFDPAIQKMYSGSEDRRALCARWMRDGCASWAAAPITGAAGAGRWTTIDFEARDWVPHSGWPFARKALEPYYPPRTGAGAKPVPGSMTRSGDCAWPRKGPLLPLGAGGLYTSWFQFSKTRDSVLPTQFGHRYEDDLKRAPNITPLLHANVTAIRLAPDAKQVDHLDVATLTRQAFHREAALYGAGLRRNGECAAAAGLQRRDEERHRQPERPGGPLLRRQSDSARCRHPGVVRRQAGVLLWRQHTMDDGAIMRATFAPTAAFRAPRRRWRVR